MIRTATVRLVHHLFYLVVLFVDYNPSVNHKCQIFTGSTLLILIELINRKNSLKNNRRSIMVTPIQSFNQSLNPDACMTMMY